MCRGLLGKVSPRTTWNQDNIRHVLEMWDIHLYPSCHSNLVQEEELKQSCKSRWGRQWQTLKGKTVAMHRKLEAYSPSIRRSLVLEPKNKILKHKKEQTEQPRMMRMKLMMNSRLTTDTRSVVTVILLLPGEAHPLQLNSFIFPLLLSFQLTLYLLFHKNIVEILF